MPATTPKMSKSGNPIPRPTPKPIFIAVDMPIVVFWSGRVIVVFPIAVANAVDVAETLVDDVGVVATEEAEMLK